MGLFVGLAAATPSVTARAEVPSREATEDPAAEFDRAEGYYRDGRYEEAAEILLRLAESYPDPTLFYNLARAHESAGQLDRAIVAYERYLDLAPEAADADAVAARIGRLRERAESEDAPQPPPPIIESMESIDTTPPASQRDGPPRRRTAPWVLLGVGSAGVAAGAVTAILAASRNREAQDEPVQARAAALETRAQRLALAGNISLAVGGTLALTGLTWGLVLVTRGRQRQVAVAPSGLRF